MEMMYVYYPTQAVCLSDKPLIVLNSQDKIYPFFGRELSYIQLHSPVYSFSMQPL